jgi:cytochrome c biogenesis protein ResB
VVDFLDTLASRTLTVAILALLTVACGVASFFDLEFALHRFYHAPWFFTLLGALAVNTAACTARDLLRRKVPLGFLMLHLGVLVLLAGGAWGYFTCVKGNVSIPEKFSSSRFYPTWKGRDRLYSIAGDSFKGRFFGIEQGGEVVFQSAVGKQPSLHLGEVQKLSVDPDRTGRKFEKDLLHLKDEGRREGFLKAIWQETVIYEVEGEDQTYNKDDVLFLRMGPPAIHALGFTLRLRAFRIEFHPETMKSRLLMQAPGGEAVACSPTVGEEVDLGNGYVARILKVVPDAVYDLKTRELSSRSDMPNNPAVQVEIRWEGGREIQIAYAMHPSFHGSRNKSGVVMRYETTEGMPKAYVSEVEVIEEGFPVRRAKIEVNAPFRYGGYTIYQSSYNAKVEPVRSVFQVVRDPGLNITFAGFLLLLLGCFEVFYVRPLRKIVRRRRGRPAGNDWKIPGTGEGRGSPHYETD